MAFQLQCQLFYHLGSSAQRSLYKYFPPKKTVKLLNDITSFFQAEGESFFEVWERFQEFQRECPVMGY